MKTVSMRKRALTARMAGVGLHWADISTKHADGFYHVITTPHHRPNRLRTLDEVAGYVKALEQASRARTKLDANDIISDFWADLAV